MNYYNDNDPYCCEWLENLIKSGNIPCGVVDSRDIRDVRSHELTQYTQCHFFAGIGGWSLALQLSGWSADIPVWTGSCPCQPFSIAGKGLGEKDGRHLWPEFLRLISECRPEVVFGEQVASAEVVGTQLEAAFALAVQRGDYARANKLAKRLVASRGFHYSARWIDRVHADMEATGYALRYSVLGAHSVGAPHIRQRLFWVSDSGCECRRAVWTESRSDQPAEIIHNQRCGKNDGASDRLADSTGGRWREELQQNSVWGYGGDGERKGRLGNCGPIDRLADSLGTRLEGRSCQPGDDEPQQPAAERAGDDADGLGNTAALRRQGSDGTSQQEPGAWSCCTLVHCRGGKTRRISAQPGDEPLAHGIPRKLGPELAGIRGLVRSARRNRTGRLRAYGNAIVPQVAAAFIRSYLDSINDIHR